MTHGHGHEHCLLDLVAVPLRRMLGQDLLSGLCDANTAPQVSPDVLRPFSSMHVMCRAPDTKRWSCTTKSISLVSLVTW